MIASTAAAASAPPPLPISSELEAILWIALFLVLSALFSVLRNSILRSNTSRLVAKVSSERARERLEALLDRAEKLIASAGILKITCDLLFLTLLYSALAVEGREPWLTITIGLVIAIPAMLLVTEALAVALARQHGDAILRRLLPPFYILQIPLGILVQMFVVVRRVLLRAVGVSEDTRSSREIVEDLRDVVKDSGRSEELDDTEREIIENVMEFRDVDVAAVMTPRTEIHGVDVEDGLPALVRVAAQEGHSRIPVYEGNIDTIIGHVSARGVVNLLADGDFESADIRQHIQPAYFVPETKPVSQLLAEFRRERQKMAIVLDEYGGTAGLVTLGDVLGEIVGEIQETFDHEEPEEIVMVSPGIAEIDASLHVSEVNDALDLQLPEEADFETLAGFVLAELGRLPKAGERFESLGAEFEVIEASDRRVIRVRVRKLEAGAEVG